MDSLHLRPNINYDQALKPGSPPLDLQRKVKDARNSSLGFLDLVTDYQPTSVLQTVRDLGYIQGEYVKGDFLASEKETPVNVKFIGVMLNCMMDAVNQATQGGRQLDANNREEVRRFMDTFTTGIVAKLPSIKDGSDLKTLLFSDTLGLFKSHEIIRMFVDSGFALNFGRMYGTLLTKATPALLADSRESPIAALAFLQRFDPAVSAVRTLLDSDTWKKRFTDPLLKHGTAAVIIDTLGLVYDSDTTKQNTGLSTTGQDEFTTIASVLKDVEGVDIERLPDRLKKVWAQAAPASRLSKFR